MEAIEHQCQRYRGLWQRDPQFPRAYQRNAWCWSPEAAFHRAEDPQRSLRVRVSHGTRLVGPDHMHAWQAMRLGLGEGTSTGGEWGLSPVFERALEVTWRYQGDADPIALFGYRCRGLSEDIDNNTRARRAVYADSLSYFLPAGLGPLDEVLLEAIDHDPADMTNGPSDLPDPIGHPTSDAESWVNLLHGSLTRERTCHGAMRTIVRLYLSTDPDQTQIADWLMHVARSARARCAEHTEAVTSAL